MIVGQICLLDGQIMRIRRFASCRRICESARDACGLAEYLPLEICDLCVFLVNYVARMYKQPNLVDFATLVYQLHSHGSAPRGLTTGRDEYMYIRMTSSIKCINNVSATKRKTAFA